MVYQDHIFPELLSDAYLGVGKLHLMVTDEEVISFEALVALTPGTRLF